VCAGDAVAEVASGNGYFALPAARITDPGTVYAVDIDPALLAELSHIADQQGIGNVETVEGDARSLARLLPEPVDTVLIANTFHGIDQVSPIVQQSFESLSPGGRFVLVNWQDLPRESTHVAGEPRGPPESLRSSPEETERRVLDAADVTLRETIELQPYHYAQVFER
jgi:ubiquinone/menaquinone biosynthesis C-methylase UbiE